VALALAALHTAGVLGDGVGLIGHGKTLYNPTCAFACRNVIKGCKLVCTPEGSTANHGTAHSPVSTPPDCFVKDDAFLRTMAICLDTYCPLSGNPPLDLLEDYWASHLGTGTLGDYQWVPAVSYHDALAAARADERRLLANNATAGAEDHGDHGEDHSSHGMRKLRTRQFMTAAGPKVTSPLPIIKAKASLNVTSFIAPADWQKQYSGMSDFETNEAGHSTYTIVVLVVAIFLPIPLSLLRFIPGIANSRAWNAFQSALINPPLYGKRHREPVVAGAIGMVPTRGQALYILLISLLNLIFLLAPYVYHHPQSTFGSQAEQELSIVGNRAGVMAMGNVVALFLFAARNNVLLWVTDWSYGTYLLLHRWLGYWAVIHTVIHSFMLWFNYRIYGDYEAELAREYWVWGIVGTVAVVALYLTSLRVVRQRLYELFLASHFVLALLFIVGYYYHIWFLYEYNWGYEIWAFVAAGIWATERVVRLVRIGFRGYRTATVSVVPDCDGEYLRIDIEDAKLGEGVAYLTFPSLRGRFWESHPFSVAFNSSEVGEVSDSSPSTPPETSADPESKEAGITNQTVTITSPANGTGKTKGSTTFLARVRTGMTSSLAKRAAASGSIRLGVVVDGPYPHSGDVATQLEQCSTILYIAGGVGITALLPYLRRFNTVPSRLCYGTRKTGLAAALEPALAALPGSVEVETVVGSRLDLDGILEKALADRADGGPLGIVVCGPAGMADHVRHKVVQLSRNGPATRAYVLVDEAFGW
jgi:predicted ferric reductase